ncbi:hypothetical protein M3689_13725 [Alkalihalophilus marmarensis]|uniref:Uncharacterized protein n=1 Tax=Alkalihalophilus marmarensis DSM 21297 TaxID=1188261 RepID=U6SIN1_9BACI|nr:hypothetical protein [Alkalihalophilus marmarensis]ERN51413.1 hypothetical protein A33I_01695 [Alkalihalophilus marmarensis DSM 21297]MCM3490374.1 hypothetical protein [Alkalihalophilus marmarensis]
MKMTKIIILALAVLLIGGTAVATTSFINSGSKEEEQVEPAFIRVTGMIESVEERDGTLYYLINEGQDETSYIIVSSDTVVFDNTGDVTELEPGEEITAYTYANKPMPLIYPPQYNPEVIIVETDLIGSAAVGTFNDELVDETLSLKLNVSEETELSSLTGKDVGVEDLEGQDLLVFYSFTTKSIPAQTTPEKIIVLDGEES